jgi:hypothetical protein
MDLSLTSTSLDLIRSREILLAEQHTTHIWVDAFGLLIDLVLLPHRQYACL